VHWADAFPNFLIGLREGLEAGLVVSLLLAALRKSERGGELGASAPIWLGVLGAVTVAGSFAAVLTFSTSVLSSRAQEAVGGILSVLAVALVTAMVFWMRRAASSIAGELRERVDVALEIGGGALALTAFLAVGREGLETTLFLWTAVRATGETLSPVVGAALGLVAAVGLCWLLFRQAVRLNLAVFFSRTAILLIVIAAGVLAYGLGELQDAALLPGRAWVAFDLSSRIATDSWWVSLVSGATELAVRMTVLQVVAWLSYLVVVIPMFVRAGHAARPASGTGHGKPVGWFEERWVRLAGRRPWSVAAAVVVVPVTVAAVSIAVLPAASVTSTTAVAVTGSQCAPSWTSGHSGTQTFTVTNTSGRAGEINLDNDQGAIVAEIETLGPATSASMTATLGTGLYTIKCYMSGQPVRTSQPVHVSGTAQTATAAIAAVSTAELEPAASAYRTFVAPKLATLATQVIKIRADLSRSEMASARSDWLAAQLTWEQIGAAYDSFGDLGDQIDGLPQGLRYGVTDHDFTGLHRLEYGLWHGQPGSQLVPIARKLQTNVAALRAQLPKITIDPTDLTIRAHEILEDALRDHLSGMTDQGAGAAYPETYADLQGTRVVLDELAPLITPRDPTLLPAAHTQMNTLQRALLAARVHGTWQTLDATPLAQRQHVDGAIGALLETLSRIPDLLEVPPTH